MDNEINYLNVNIKRKKTASNLLRYNLDSIKNKLKLQVSYFTQLYENSIKAVAILDNEDKIININKSFTRIFNYIADEVRGRYINDCIVDRELTEDMSDISQIVLNDGFVSKETLRKSKDGRLVNVKMTAFPMLVNNNQVGACAIYEDITEQKRIELGLKKHQEWLEVTLSSIGDGVIATDREGKIKFMNNAAQELTGYTIKEAIGQKLGSVFDIVYGKAYDKMDEIRDCLFLRIINDGINFKSDESICLISKDNRSYNIAVSGCPIRSDRQENIGMVVTFQNITERFIIEQRFKKMSIYDSLTDVYNRAYFQDVLTECDYEKLTGIGMVVCDLDGLKIINDTLGHCGGDELIVNAACILKELCMDKWLVSRIGGDEFVVFMKNCNADDVENLNKEIQNRIEVYNIQNNKIHLSMSTGTAFNGSNYKPMKDIFKEADNNMYICKLSRK